MKRLLLLLSVFSLLSFSMLNETKTEIKVSSKSTLYVEGKTNINKFNCNFDITTIDNKIPVTYSVSDNSIKFHNAQLTLKNTCFDCGNKGMNKDFQKLLKTETYPQIVLTLQTISLNSINQDEVKATINIDMAGTSKTYHTFVKVSENEGYAVNGQLEIDITDFNLEPPQKMLGMIKVNETITINFNLILEY